MSQKKVDQYKKYKDNRKKEEKRKKMKYYFDMTIFGLIIVASLGWIGYSAVQMHLDNKPRQVVEADYTAFGEYLQGLVTEE